jgi:ribonuclease HI
MGDTPHGTLKLNVNRAFRDSDKNGGWGYVIRDERGVVIQSGSGRASFAINPIQMELIASIEGVKATISLGVNNIILEIDAQQVVWAIQQVVWESQGDDFRLAVVGGLGPV